MDIHQPQHKPQIKATLYLGQEANGEYIAPMDFQTFLEESVTPRYPGFTLVHCDGYWKGKRENAAMLIVLLDDDANARNGIRIVAEQYKTRFAQEAVTYSFEPCQFTLDCWPHGPVGTYHRDGKGY